MGGRTGRSRSFAAQLAVSLVLLSLSASAVLGWLSYRSSQGFIRREAERSVALAAHARREVLARILHAQRDRAATFLDTAQTSCGRRGGDVAACVRHALDEFLAGESATGATLFTAGRPPVRLGAAPTPSTPTLAPGELARFGFEPAGDPYYLVQARVGTTALVLRFALDEIHTVFADRVGLGASGETFLTDRQGRFLTPRRYAKEQPPTAASHPVATVPMRACLGAASGVSLAHDYRPVAVIHGFQPVFELGAGCIMAHMDQAEAYAPLASLRLRACLLAALFAMLTVSVSILFALRVSRPLARLSARAEALRRGDFDSPVPTDGPAEVRDFANTFSEMAKSIQSSQAALRSSEQRMRAILDNALDAVIAMDEHGRITGWNPRAETLFGWRCDEVLGRRLSETIIPERYRARHEAGLQRFLATGEGPVLGRRLEVVARCRDGTELPVELAITPSRVADGWLFSAFINDITERKRAEAERAQLLQRERAARADAEQAVRMRDEFLSIASHELKTPLTSLGLQMQSVSRLAERAQVPIPPERLRALLDVSRRQIRRLASLIEELLDVSRISHGRLTLHPEQVELTALTREVVARLASNAEQARCTVEVVAPEPITGRWDRLRIEQVLTNLVTNALKYGPGAPVTITVGIEGRHARLEVRDRGLGVPPEAHDKIFQRFERAVSPRHFGGLGLGLYIVREILEVHGGSIRVESVPGQGAAFIVHLPIGDD